MANVFSFCGEIRPVRDTEKFKGYEEKVFDSKWISKKLRWNMVCGDNSHLVEVNAGEWQDSSKNVVYTFFAGKDGGKSEKTQIKWADRFNEDVVNKVANFRKFVVDLNLPNALKEAEESGNTEAIESAKKKRKEFISEVDFIEYLQKLVNSEKIKGLKFRVIGNIEFSYSPSKGMFYKNYIVQKIYRAADDAEPSSTGTLDLFFNEGCVDSDAYDETKKHIVSAYTQFYDSNFKKNIFAPIQLIINGDGDEKTNKLATGLKKKFEKIENDEVRKIGVGISILNGSQRVEIDESMLSDEQKENIEYGLCTLDDIRRELGGSVYGDRVQETRIIGLARGYSSGSVETAFSSNDLTAIPSADVDNESDDIDIDIFDDDLEI